MCTCCYLETREAGENPWSSLKNTYEIKKRAGTIVLDYKNKKILIVQTYGSVWGPPKGSVDKNESFVSCAIRETQEETGLFLSKKELNLSKKLFDDSTWYYTVKADKYRNDICLKSITSNEVTGIGWVCLSCLDQLIEQKKTNSHLNKLRNYIHKKLEIN